MNILLSLPPNVVANGCGTLPRQKGHIYYLDSDPADRKLGSGGGTSWIVNRFHDNVAGREKKTIVIHGGGQSRRLPSYAVTGKTMTPLPVLRWAVGERIDQTLLDLQLPLLEDISRQAPGELNTLIASGDVLIRNNGALPPIPQADVVCFGMWTEPEQARNHGVFFIPRQGGQRQHILNFMLQKPSLRQLAELGSTHYYLTDIGLWLLSDRAMKILNAKSTGSDGKYRFYDLYSDFGCALGEHPSHRDGDLDGLSVAVIPLPKGEFYHFGTTRQLLSTTLRLQNLVADQRRIMHLDAKPNPALFVQNCLVRNPLTERNNNVWIENSVIGKNWTLTSENVVTGVPDNDWSLTLEPGQCLDMVPVGEKGYAVRPYGYDDAMKGDPGKETTMFLGQPYLEWAKKHEIDNAELATDIQSLPLFPIVGDIDDAGKVAAWMFSDGTDDECRKIWLESEKLSADMLMERANLTRLYSQRAEFLKKNLPMLSANRNSVFYQLDLTDTARKIHDFALPGPQPLDERETVTRRLRNLMLRSRLQKLDGRQGINDEQEAFSLMRESILSNIDVSRPVPRLDVHPDQIVWGRSPVRIDLAGGWTDTPPYSLLYGGAVVNMAVELNGQPPLQVFIKPSKEFSITLRSIDLGASETIDTFDRLTDFARIGSPFSLPKAALSIAGFAPGFSNDDFPSLESLLRAFGAGIEITLLSALPAGSGMGTSSILAATILGALSDFAGLGWTADEICQRTLAVEQMLTSGGGWQDQYGGVLQGVKLLQTESSPVQIPSVNWLPESIFTSAEYAPCHILYYTGITRTAKAILAEIVRNMFLNHGETLALLGDMKEHAAEMAHAIQRCDFRNYGHLVSKSWAQNCRLDSGTCPDEVKAIIDSVNDLTLGMKLPGAGGGGYLYMVAKDPEAAAVIRRRLSNRGTARFAELAVSTSGLQISRS